MRASSDASGRIRSRVSRVERTASPTGILSSTRDAVITGGSHLHGFVGVAAGIPDAPDLGGGDAVVFLRGRSVSCAHAGLATRSPSPPAPARWLYSAEQDRASEEPLIAPPISRRGLASSACSAVAELRLDTGEQRLQ